MYSICSCFEFRLPKSTSDTIIVPPMDKTFITGIAYAYDTSFPPQLTNIIDPKIYFNNIFTLNNMIQDYWPCTCAEFILGYGCCLCTFGLSLCIPTICLSDAEEAAQRQIKYINETLFKQKGLQMKLKKRRPLSYLEIKIPKRKLCSNQIEQKEVELINEGSQKQKNEIDIIMNESDKKEIEEENLQDNNQLI